MKSNRHAKQEYQSTMPPRVREYYRKKHRYETQTPIAGMGCASLLLVGFLVMMNFGWSLILIVGVLCTFVVILRYHHARQVWRCWEDELQEWHSQR